MHTIYKKLARVARYNFKLIYFGIRIALLENISLPRVEILFSFIQIVYL